MNFLLGRGQSGPVDDDLRAQLQNPYPAATTIAGAAATLFLDFRQHRKFAVVPGFAKMLMTAGDLIDPSNARATAVQTADLLCTGFDGTSLALLMVQSFPQGFGAMLFEALLERIETEQFGRVIDVLRQQEVILRRVGVGGGG